MGSLIWLDEPLRGVEFWSRWHPWGGTVRVHYQCRPLHLSRCIGECDLWWSESQGMIRRLPNPSYGMPRLISFWSYWSWTGRCPLIVNRQRKGWELSQSGSPLVSEVRTLRHLSVSAQNPIFSLKCLPLVHTILIRPVSIHKWIWQVCRLLRFHSYAYHIWTYPTFSYLNPWCHPDITMTSFLHHYDIISTYDLILLHHYIIMTSSFTYDLTLLHYDVITRTL